MKANHLHSSSSEGSSSSFSPRLSLSQTSSFCADNELVTIVPMFNYPLKMVLSSYTSTSSSAGLSSNNNANANGGGNDNNNNEDDDDDEFGDGTTSPFKNSKQQQRNSNTTNNTSSRCDSGLIIGPFVSGVPTHVPIWVAKSFHARRLVQIQIPDWLSSQHLQSVLEEERTSPLLSRSLPFYYMELYTSLSGLLVEPQCHILIQDVTALREDKLRQNFHDISYETLQQPDGLVGEENEDDDDDDVDDEDPYGGGVRKKSSTSTSGKIGSSNVNDGRGRDVLPTIDITGVASYELNKVGPFFQRAFTDYGYLTTRISNDEYQTYYFDTTSSTAAKSKSKQPKQQQEEEEEEDPINDHYDNDDDMNEDVDGMNPTNDDDDDDDDGDDHIDDKQQQVGSCGGLRTGSTTRRILGGGRSRLRRFR